MFSRGVARGEFQFMYSRSHCLAMMPNRAAAKLRTRLTKNRALMHREELGMPEGGGTMKEDKFRWRDGDMDEKPRTRI